MRLGRCYTEVDERLGDAEPLPLLSVSQYRGVIRRSQLTDKPPRADSFEKYKVVGQGDLVLNRFNAYRGSLGAARETGIVSPDYLVLRPNFDASGAFLEYLLRSDRLSNAMKQTMGGIGAADPDASGFSRISVTDLAKFEFDYYPAFADQKVVAQFLDVETGKIDALISKQEQLVATLQEDCVAIVTDCVTKGLDPHVEMKESGVQWIGRTPAHWDVCKATRIGTPFGSESVPEAQITDSGDTPFLKVSSLDQNALYPNPPSWFVSAAYRAEQNFIVFPKRGGAIFGNKVNIVRSPSVIDPNLMGWKLELGNLPEFFARVLKLIRLEEIADVSTVPQINTKHIANIRLPRPPEHEQKQIVAALDSHFGRVDALISKANQMIELLQEYRTALITDAITGKIDVREAV